MHVSSPYTISRGTRKRDRLATIARVKKIANTPVSISQFPSTRYPKKPRSNRASCFPLVESLLRPRSIFPYWIRCDQSRSKAGYSVVRFFVEEPAKKTKRRKVHSVRGNLYNENSSFSFFSVFARVNGFERDRVRYRMVRTRRV